MTSFFILKNRPPPGVKSARHADADFSTSSAVSAGGLERHFAVAQGKTSKPGVRFLPPFAIFRAVNAGPSIGVRASRKILVLR
jgi:hypothetical protein